MLSRWCRQTVMRGATSAGSEQGLVAALPVGGPLGWGAGRGRQVRPPGEGAHVGAVPVICGWFGLAGLRRRRAGSDRVLRGRPVAGFSTGLSVAGVGMRR